MLRRHWLHSESWWPRLLRGQPAIAWDDYEKDYSDLPREARALHTLLASQGLCLHARFLTPQSLGRL